MSFGNPKDAYSHAEFADTPSPLPNLSHLSVSSSPNVSEPEEIVPAERPPTTLIQWAVLILNTANPTLKVRVILNGETITLLKYL